MGGLLDLALKAHGGLERWNRFTSVRAEMAIGGAIFAAKQNPDLLKQTTCQASTHEEKISFWTSNGSDRLSRFSRFSPGHLVLEDPRGRVVDERQQPRKMFDGHRADTPWSDLQMLYFCSYALWTYLTIPFLYSYEGFQTEELSPWEENGEEWRRLRATFPPSIESHTREQVSYFGPDGLLRRHDYTVDVLQGATGANYATGYEDFGGVVMPTTRRVFAYDARSAKVPQPTLVTIDISNAEFT